MSMLNRMAGLALVLFASAATAQADDNPLVGTVWTGSGEAADYADIETTARAADFVLIGEIHDNPEHHEIQAALIRAMTEAGRKPAVVFEMVPHGLQGELDAFQAEGSQDLAELGTRLNWEERGWPDWSIYQPVAAAALAAKLPLYAGDLDRETIRAIGRGEAGVDDGVAYPQTIRTRLGREIMTAHCDLMPEEAIPAMIDVQQARDLSMAAAMLDHGVQDGAVLISGAGHARTDWGVPFVLTAKAPEKAIVSVGLMEVSDEATDFADYLDEGETALPYDYVMFTAKTDDTDHCAELRKQMGK